MTKILLVGSGTREHALAVALSRSTKRPKIFNFGSHRNPGIEPIAAEIAVGKLTDFEAICAFAKRIGADWAFIGPDNPIGDGLADALEAIGIPSFAPKKALARLESSKGFTRNLVEKYGIPGNPEFRVFETGATAEEIGVWIDHLGGEFVVKYDALLGGKGVKLSGEHLANAAEGIAYALECIAECGRVVIEEKFVGEEFSLLAFVDGKTVVPMPAIQDHKRAFSGDIGPNTGGMGTISDADGSLPFLEIEDIKEAIATTEAVMKALEKECGERFCGVMYGGFIATRRGTRLIEYNARFGDPEVMNLMTLLDSDLVEICEAAIAGRLSKVKIEFKHEATVCKYIVPEGYPDEPVKGEPIEIGALPEGVDAYFGSVSRIDGKLVMGSSRAIALVASGKTIPEAEKLVEAATAAVKGKVFHREDIGTAKLLQKRIDRMQGVRSEKG